MAKTELSSAFENLSGKLNKADQIIYRQKKYRSATGAVISTASLEAYAVFNPRDYKKNPPKGTELRNIQSFADASRITTLIIRAGKYTREELAAMTDSERQQALEYRDQFEHFKARFMAQLKKPDQQAPILPKTDPQFNPNSSRVQRRTYRTLNTFIRAMVLQAIKLA